MYVYTFIFFTVYRRKNTNALITCEPLIRLIRMNGWKISLPRSKVSYNEWRDLGMYGLRGHGWEAGRGWRGKRDEIVERVHRNRMPSLQKLWTEYRETEWRKDMEKETEDNNSGILRSDIYIWCVIFMECKISRIWWDYEFLLSISLSLSHTHTHTHTHTHAIRSGERGRAT